MAKALHRKILRFLLCLFKPGKKIWTKISKKFMSSRMNTSLVNTSFAKWIQACEAMWRVFKLLFVTTDNCEFRHTLKLEPQPGAFVQHSGYRLDSIWSEFFLHSSKTKNMWFADFQEGLFLKLFSILILSILNRIKETIL